MQYVPVCMAVCNRYRCCQGHARAPACICVRAALLSTPIISCGILFSISDSRGNAGPYREGVLGGSDEPPRTAREFRFFVEDLKSFGITAREIVRVRTSVHRALTSYRDDMPKPKLFSAEQRR